MSEPVLDGAWPKKKCVRMAEDRAIDRPGRFRARTRTSALALALEPRFMFDAAGVATGADAAVEAAAQEAADQPAAEQTDDTVDTLAQALTAIAPPGNRDVVAFVDPTVDDAAAIIAALGSAAEVVILNPETNAVDQIADVLTGRSGLEAIHIFSHGNSGQLVFASGTLDLGTLGDHGAALETIGAALSLDGDIFLYGCDVGAGADGAAFLKALAQATNADVAASDDPTGSADLGGDWDLERSEGSVDRSEIDQRLAASGFSGILAADDDAAEDEEAPAVSLAAASPVAAANADPVISGLSDQTFDQNAVGASHQKIGGGFVLNDPNGTISSGATLQVENMTPGQNFLESFWIDTDGTGLSVSDIYEISVDGRVVGSIGGGVNGGALAFIFNASATIADIQRIGQNVTYRVTNDVPETTRPIEFRVQDGDGGSVSETITVTVVAENEAPRHATAVVVGEMDQVRRVEHIDTGGWRFSRYPAARFDTVTFDGDTRIRIGVDAGSPNPGLPNYEGFGTDIDPATEVSAQLYLPADWGTTGTGRVSIWGYAYSADAVLENGIGWPVYNIIEYNEALGDFRVWDGSSWNEMGLPADATRDTWYDISMVLDSDAGTIVSSVTGMRTDGSRFTISYTDTSIGDKTSFRDISLEIRNDGTSTFDAYWDNITTNAGRSDETSVWATAAVEAGETVAIHGLAVADRDGDILTTTLSSDAGQIRVADGGTASVSGNGTATVTVSGTVAEINTALAGLSFRPDLSTIGMVEISAVTSDGQLFDRDMIMIDVSNDGPDGLATDSDAPFVGGPPAGDPAGGVGSDGIVDVTAEVGGGGGGVAGLLSVPEIQSAGVSNFTGSVGSAPTLFFDFPMAEVVLFASDSETLSSVESREGVLRLVAEATEGGSLEARESLLLTFERLGLFADGTVNLAELRGEIDLFGMTLSEVLIALEGVDLQSIDTVEELLQALELAPPSQVSFDVDPVTPVSSIGSPGLADQISAAFLAFDRDAAALGLALAHVGATDRQRRS